MHINPDGYPVYTIGFVRDDAGKAYLSVESIKEIAELYEAWEVLEEVENIELMVLTDTEEDFHSYGDADGVE